MSANIAKLLVKNNVLVFEPVMLIRFKSGMRAPVFLDHKRVFENPEDAQQIIGELVTRVEHLSKVDMLAACGGTGSLLAVRLANKLQLPLIIIDDKDFGPKPDLAATKDKKVLLVEDHVSTGGSSFAAVERLRSARASITDVLSISHYDFVSAEVAFQKSKLQLTALVTLPELIKEAIREAVLTKEDAEVVEEWYREARYA